jgi:predicted CoA-binding protein
MSWSDPETARAILTGFRVWAVVGCSPNPMRASHGVSRFLIARGYDVIPIYPRRVEIHGLTAAPDLRTAADGRRSDARIEVVDVFRASHRVRPHVEEAIEIGAKAVWMQLGVWDPDSAQLAADAGLLVVMNRCPAIDHPALVGAR